MLTQIFYIKNSRGNFSPLQKIFPKNFYRDDFKTYICSVMAQFQKTLFISKFDACMYHTMILNAFMRNRFTHGEVEVIAAFASMGDSLSLEARKKVKSSLELSDAGLTNYISSLKKKGAIIMKDNKPVLLPVFLIDPKENEYLIKTVIKDEA